MDGIIVIDRWEHGIRLGKRYSIRAWGARDRTYKTRRFDDLNAGVQWAKDETAELRVGISQAGALDAEEASKTYLRYLIETKRRTAIHTDSVSVVLREARKHGMTNLLAPNVGRVVQSWLDTATSSHPRRKGRPISPATKIKFAIILRAFGRWLVRNDYLRRSPFEKLETPERDRKLRETFTFGELRELLASEREKDPYFLLFAVLIYTGMRYQEAVYLRWQEIDFAAKRIKVRLPLGDGSEPEYRLKRRKERRIPLQPELEVILRRCVPTQLQLARKGYLFEPDIRNAIRKTSCRRFEAYVMRVLYGDFTPQKGAMSKGVKKPDDDRTPHSTRHTWVAMQLASGQNEVLVQAYAGHTSLTTTAGYASAQDSYVDEIREAAWKPGEFRLRGESPRPEAATGTEPKSD